MYEIEIVSKRVWYTHGMAAEGGAKGPVHAEIERKLQAGFAPTHLEVVNESYNHCVPKGAETHFKVVVISDKFAGVLPLERHR